MLQCQCNANGRESDQMATGMCVQRAQRAQCAAVCCSVLQCVAVCGSVSVLPMVVKEIKWQLLTGVEFFYN